MLDVFFLELVHLVVGRLPVVPNTKHTSDWICTVADHCTNVWQSGKDAEEEKGD